MSITEIVRCYVRARVPKPVELSAIRRSLVENGFDETVAGARAWRYKRGSPIALEFDYDSEAIEVQVHLRELDSELEISVGNWGFPFEPLLSKTRYLRILDRLVEEISTQGSLVVRPGEAQSVARLASQKRKAAIGVLVALPVVWLIVALVGGT